MHYAFKKELKTRSESLTHSAKNYAIGIMHINVVSF